MPKVPFTEEQVTWLEESRRQSVRGAVRKYRNEALVGYFVLLIGIAVVFGFQRHETHNRVQQGVAQRDAIVRSGTAVAVDGCNRDFHTIRGTRHVLEDAREFQRAQHKKGLITDEQYQRANDFYSTQLAHIPLPDCRLAEKIITQNPDKPVTVPTPLHP